MVDCLILIVEKDAARAARSALVSKNKISQILNLNPNNIIFSFYFQRNIFFWLFNMNPSAPLETVIGKLMNGWTMETLPVRDTNPFWLEIRRDCNLTAPEVVLLQNEIARRNEGLYYHLFFLLLTFFHSILCPACIIFYPLWNYVS